MEAASAHSSAFDLFLIGFGFTLFIGLVGFVFILLGGWLMLRAWRINKYGTTNSKVIAKEAATRPRGRAAQRGGQVDLQDEPRHPARPKATDREQALHAEGAAAEEDPQADRVARAASARIAVDGVSRLRLNQSSAERSSRSTSARRRTSERAVGSSPSARSTSTSVTIPITVE